MIGRAPYLVAGAVGLAVLLALAAIEPLGHAWVWFEFPRRMTLMAFVIGMAGVASGRVKWGAALLPVGIGILSYMLELRHAHKVVAELGWSAIPESDKQLMFKESFEVLAPWFLGGCYAVLVALSGWRRKDRRDRWRAGLWLVAVAAIGAAFVLANDNWLTLANLSKPGTYTSSVPWPDSKLVAIVVCALAGAAGAVLMVSGRVPKPDDPIPRARVLSS